MKNKKILFIILILLIIIVAISTFFLIKKINSNNNTIIQKGYELFGNKYCNGHTRDGIIVDGWPSYSTCEICGITKHNDAAYSDFIICSECAKITRRCTKCGNLLK